MMMMMMFNPVSNLTVIFIVAILLFLNGLDTKASSTLANMDDRE